MSRGTLGGLAADFDGRAVKGEIVLLVGRAVAQAPDEEQIEDRLRRSLADKSVKDAAAEVALEMGLARRDVYQLALRLAKEDE